MATLAELFGTAGDPRRVPRAGDVRTIDPNDELGPIMAASGAASAPGLAAFLGGSPSHGVPNMGQPQGAAGETIAEQRAPERARQGGLFGFLGGNDDGGLRDTLGRIGDALLVSNELPAMYAPRRAERMALERERKLGEAMAAFVGDNPMLADIARIDPRGMGAMLYNAGREDRRFERTAGQADRRIDNQTFGTLPEWARINEATRSNRAREGLTERGQDIGAQQQQLNRAHRTELARLESELAAARAAGNAQLEAQLHRQKRQIDSEFATANAALANYFEGGGEETVTTIDPETGAETKRTRRVAPTGPAPGTVQQGYRFNGGDPADPANWTKVR